MKTNLIFALAVMIAGSAFAQVPQKQESAKPIIAPSNTMPVQQTKPAAAPATAPAVENKNAPEFKFNELEHSFGEIKQGDVVNYEFQFTNIGKDPLIISTASGSCGCTVPDWPKAPIKKGEAGNIKVTFNSAGKSGMQDKTVTINSNAKNSPHILHIRGNVIGPAAGVSVSPATPAAAPATPDKK